MANSDNAFAALGKQEFYVIKRHIDGKIVERRVHYRHVQGQAVQAALATLVVSNGLKPSQAERVLTAARELDPTYQATPFRGSPASYADRCKRNAEKAERERGHKRNRINARWPSFDVFKDAKEALETAVTFGKSQ